MPKFKPVYIPIALTGILLLMALATGFCAVKDLTLTSMENYTSTRSFLIIFFLLILPLTLFLMMIAGFAYIGLIIGVWVFYGICILIVKFIKKHFMKEDSTNANISQPDSDSDSYIEIIEEDKKDAN